MNLNRFLSRKKLFLVALVVLNLFLLGTLLFGNHRTALRNAAPPNGQYPEIQELQARSWNFQDLSAYFRKLADTKGAVYAFEVLKIAPIPPNTDLHLLGHTVGDELYKQQGLNGVRVCTQDFRNACSHSIVVGALLEKGDAVFREVNDVCHKAPGGRGAYTMCFHGFGHGVLAYASYDMERTIHLCEKVGTAAYNNQETAECIGGAVMEMISGGFHDPVTWREQRSHYLHVDAPLALCAGPMMPELARNMCYTYLTPYLFEVAGADMGRPGPEDFKKAFAICERIPVQQKETRSICFGGFGKEFVVLAQDRDIRRIDQMTDPQLKRVAEWCELAGGSEEIQACVFSALQSLFWGGENDPRAAIQFCRVLGTSSEQQECFDSLFGAANFYLQDRARRESFCSLIETERREVCQQRLLSDT